MKVSLLKATAFLSAAVFAASVGTAHAQNVTKEDAKCRGTNGKNVTKLASTISKAFDGCIKTAVKDGTGSCTTTAGADAAKQKVPGTKDKLLAGIEKSCDDTIAAISLAEHQLCGTPVGGAIANFAQVGACLNDLVDKNMERLKVALLQPDYVAALADETKLSGKCINAIAKNSTKYLSTIMKEHSKAVKTSDKGLGLAGYKNPGATPKITTAAEKLDAGLLKACGEMTDGQWGIVRTCDDDLAGAQACIKAKVQAIAEGLIASAYDQPGSCPDSVMVQIHHDGADGVRLSATDLDVGFTGFGHNAGVIDGFHGAVKLNCGGPTGNDCTVCDVTSDCSEGNCRCTSNGTGEMVIAGTEVNRTCQNPFTQDTCGTGNTCIPYFGPPLPLSANGTSTCVVNKIASELDGTANIATGESDTSVDNVARVYLDVTQVQPCPTCVAGKCNGGARDTLDCTVDGTSAVFGDVSYDCPPTGGAGNISGAGLKISLDLTDGLASLGADLPCDPLLVGKTCACSVCSEPGAPAVSDLSNTPCNSNAECAAAVGATSVCQIAGSPGGVGVVRVPNTCGTTCDSVGGGEAECTGESTSFCDGYLKGNGGGVLPCTNNDDCTAFSAEAGNCTVNTPKSCFQYPVAATGTPGSEGAVLVSTFCSPPTNNPGVNSAAGTPGPTRVKLDFEFFGRCADGSPWGPGGANCQ